MLDEEILECLKKIEGFFLHSWDIANKLNKIRGNEYNEVIKALKRLKEKGVVRFVSGKYGYVGEKDGL